MPSLQLPPMKRVLIKLKDGSTDGATVISKNEERLKFLRFTIPIMQKRGLIYYLKNRKNPISWNDFKDLKGLKIGIVLGNNYVR